GAMVGGPNRNFEDMAIREKISDTTPSAKVYLDNNMSYSTNEVAVYWNSSLIFLISSLRR
ncbi:MAG: glycoside hydrolase family 9 protein, partial [Erysipelotrichaceae bacterium]